MKINKSFKSLSVFGLATFLVLVGCENSNSADESSTKAVAEAVEKVGEVEISKVEKVAEEVREKTTEAAEPVVVAAAETTEAPKATAGVEHVVKMLNTGELGTMVFEPAFLKVNVGDTVKFQAVDLAHDSVSVFAPEGAAGWKGENSKDVVAKLDVEGVYIYNCTPHAIMGMVGVIQVGEAKNKADAESAAIDIAAKFMMNKDRLTGLMSKVQ